MNRIINLWANKEYTQVFDFESETYKAAINILY